MKLAVLTCAAFPTEEEARRKLWIFLRSCEKFNIDPILYGIGTSQFVGYKRMMLDMQLDALNAIPEEFSHVLFTDGWDAMFIAPLEEIILKYQAMGCPRFLASAYINLGNESDMTPYEGMFDESIPYRYPNRGGYIASLPSAIHYFGNMVAMPEQTGDDCFNWYTGWRQGWFRPRLDSDCEIFQVSDMNATIFQGKLRNSITKSSPCILHLSGGYTDPETGKDAVLKPWARALGII